MASLIKQQGSKENVESALINVTDDCGYCLALLGEAGSEVVDINKEKRKTKINISHLNSFHQ